MSNDDEQQNNPSFQIEKNKHQTKRGIECIIHKWTPCSSSQIRGIAIIYHGFAAHARYPTVDYVAELVVSKKFVVYAMDMPGHGLSSGVRGLLPTVSDMVEDCTSVVVYTRQDCDDNKNLPIFLIGSSMGGALALQVSQQLSSTAEEENAITGVIMLAPMLSLNVSTIEQKALGALAWLAPTLAVIPSSATSSEKQYRDPERKKSSG